MTWTSPFREFLKASATVRTWNILFQTKFYNWTETSEDKVTITPYVRATEYSIPVDLVPHIFHVMNVVDTDPSFTRKSRKSLKMKESAAAEHVTSTAYSTVSSLDSFYSLSSNAGTSSLSQAVFETNNEYFNPADLTTFQNTFGLPAQAAIDKKGSYSSTCTSSSVHCFEGNLDLQVSVIDTNGIRRWLS